LLYRQHVMFDEHSPQSQHHLNNLHTAPNGNTTDCSTTIASG